MRRPRLLALAALAAALLALPQAAHAWSHQGHILLTRLACLRIINDAAAPAELKAFLQKNMKYDMEAARKLAVEEMVGSEPKNYQVGIDGAATWPDRVQQLDEGKDPIEPYGVPESKMHFLDMEYFAKEPVYKADLSNRPAVTEFPRDVKDARYKVAGFVPLRVDECYKNLVAEFAKKDLDNDVAVRGLGYLAHYIEDCHQPHHSTIDFKSLSYLAGKIPAVKAVTTQSSDGKDYTDYRVSRTAKINPHGDLEFQLFENADEPRKTYREDFWKELTARIDTHAAARAKDNGALAAPKPFDGFTKSLEILSDSYTYLPAIGEAAQAAYDSGKFDAKAFFTHESTVNNQKLTIVQLIADRNASAVLEVESALRQAWSDSHK